MTITFTKGLDDICTCGRDGTHLTKTKWAMKTLFSCRGLHPRLHVIKLLASLTYPLKMTKASLPRILHRHDHVLIDTKHHVGLIRVIRCG
jgi:hypothetical protein